MRVLSELYRPQFVIAASRPSVLIWVVILLSNRGLLSSTSPLAFQHLEIRQVVRLSQSVFMNVLKQLYILPTSKRSVRRGRMQAEQQGGWCQEEGERTPRCPTPPLWHFSQPWNSTWNWTTYTVALSKNFFVFFFLDKLDWDLPTSSEQGCKTQGSQRLSLHSFEQCPLPPASPTTLVTRVTLWMWYVSLPCSKRLQSWIKRRLEWPSYVQGHRDNLLLPWTQSPCTELVAQLDDHPDNKEHLAHRSTFFRSHISILALISLSYLLFMYLLKIKVS